MNRSFSRTSVSDQVLNSITTQNFVDMKYRLRYYKVSPKADDAVKTVDDVKIQKKITKFTN